MGKSYYLRFFFLSLIPADLLIIGDFSILNQD